MKRVYATTTVGQVHFRVMGSGEPLVLLHDCHGSHADLTSIGEHAARECTIIVPDLPGLGHSNGPRNGTDLNGYAQILLDGLTELGIDRFHLYGIGGGAVIALHIGAEAGDRVATLTCAELDFDVSGGISEAAQLSGILAPREDGSHMLMVWNHIRDTYLFRPWYSHRLSSRRRIDIPSAERLHEAAMSVLAGSSYYPALVQAVSEADGIELLRKIRCPLLLIDSLHVKSAAEEFDSVCTETDGDRAEVLLGHTARARLTPAVTQQITKPLSQGIWRSYVETRYGQVHVRQAGDGGRPLVLLHSAGNSAQALESMIMRFASHRTVIAPDTFGNGDSDKPTMPHPGIRVFSQILGETLDSLGKDSVDVWGTHTGALIGLELAIRQPGRVRALIMESPLVTMTAKAISDILKNYFPPFQIDPFGLHLVKAWHIRRDMWLFWPWYNRTRTGHRNLELPDPDLMQPWVLNLLSAGRSWHLPYRAAFRYPARKRLPLLRVPSLVCAGEGDMLAPGMKEAAHIAPSCTQIQATPATPWYPNQPSEAVEATLEIYERFFEEVPA